MRILLFLATNLAVLVLVSVIFNLLGLEGILANNGVDLNLDGNRRSIGHRLFAAGLLQALSSGLRCHRPLLDQLQLLGGAGQAAGAFAQDAAAALQFGTVVGAQGLNGIE